MEPSTMSMDLTSPRRVRRSVRAGLSVALFLLLPRLAWTEDAEPPAASADSADDSSGDEAVTNAPAAAVLKPELRARVRITADYRKQGSSKDTDLYGNVYGSATDLKNGHIDFYTSIRLHRDLDPTSSSSLADDPYRSVDDAHGVTEDRIIQLYADVHDRAKRATLRVGRQYIDMADYLHIDGVRLGLLEEGRLGGAIYAGRPVSYYSSLSGDFASGVSLVGKPWAGNQTRVTVSRYRDDRTHESDRDYYVDTHQDWTDTTKTRGQLSLLNDEFRMGRVDVYYFAVDGESDLALGGSRWGSFDAKTRAYSPLYNVLGEQDPYTYAYARLTKQLSSTFSVSPGVSLRFADDGKNAFNNRDYQDYDLTFIYEPNRVLSASVGVEYWDVQASDSFAGLTGEVRYRHRRIWEVSGGASYARYTYDTYSDLSYTVNGGQTVFSENGTVMEESPYVRTYYLRAKWKINHTLTLRLQGDMEDDESAPDVAYRARGSIEVRY